MKRTCVSLPWLAGSLALLLAALSTAPCRGEAEAAGAEVAPPPPVPAPDSVADEMDGWYTELVGAEGAEGAAATADNEGVVPPPAAGPEDSLQRPATEDEEDDGFMDSFFDEWTEKMEGFHPSAVLSLDIAPKASEFFYEHVRKAGTLLRGMFYTLSRDEDINVRLVIRTPSGDSVYQREAGDGIYAFEAKVPGVYQFEFSNSHWMTPVGLTVQAGSDEHSVLRSAHVQGTKSRLGELKSHVDSVYAQYKFLWLRNLRSIRAAHEAQLNLLLYALVQFIVVALCSVLCVWYVKRIVSHKRLL